MFVLEAYSSCTVVFIVSISSFWLILLLYISACLFTDDMFENVDFVLMRVSTPDVLEQFLLVIQFHCSHM